jgi:glycosyltransferase involved in cell wall biosynthesis
MSPNKNRGDFSVLLPTCNREDLCKMFGAAIESVYNNSLQPAQVIVVVDGPLTDNFKDKIRKYQKHYEFEVVWLKEKSGLTKALNIGLGLVTSKWTFRADGDDVNMDYRFLEQYILLEEGYELVGGWAREIDRGGNELGTRKVPETDEEIRKYIRYRNPFNHMTVAYSTERARKVGGYPSIYLREDYGLWASMLNDGAKTYNIQKILVHASAGAEQYMRRSGRSYLVAEYSLQKHLIAERQTTMILGLLIGFLRAIVFGSPKYLHMQIYRRLLRSY